MKQALTTNTKTFFSWKLQLLAALLLISGVAVGFTGVTHAAVPRLLVNVVGAWNMDESPINASSTVHDSLGLNPGTTSYAWSGSSTSPLSGSGTGAFYFPGWTNLTGSKTVDTTASSYTIPHNVAFNPETKDFSVSVWVNSLDPTPLVQSGVLKSTDTLNIVQKGLAGPTLQQWKVSVNTVGRFICTFRGPDNNGSVINYEVRSKIYPFKVTRQVVCSLSAGTIGLQVISNGVADTYSGAGPVGGVQNLSDVNVGKKTDSNHAGDTFAGTLDDLVISKGL